MDGNTPNPCVPQPFGRHHRRLHRMHPALFGLLGMFAGAMLTSWFLGGRPPLDFKTVPTLDEMTHAQRENRPDLDTELRLLTSELVLRRRVELARELYAQMAGSVKQVPVGQQPEEFWNGLVREAFVRADVFMAEIDRQSKGTK